jgi:thioesterase domain-containing protein
MTEALSKEQMESYLYQQIPISRALGVKVECLSLHKVILSAPFANNINHQKTVFGGSLHSVATLACWSLLYMNLLHLQPIQIVITKSEVTYYAPIDSDFKVECLMADPEDWKRFKKILYAKGKSRIYLSARIDHLDQLCLDYKGRFAAIRI